MPKWYWVGYFASWLAVIFTSGVGFCFVVNIGKVVNCRSSSGYASQWLFLVVYIMIQGCMTFRSVGHWKTLSNVEVPDLGSELHPSYIFVILLYYMMLPSWLVTQSFDLHCACGCSGPTRAKPSTDTQLLTEIVLSRLSVSTVLW